jgi:lysophospholipase L1-like esterase
VKRLRALAAGVVSSAVIVAGCASPPQPTPVPPPVITPDPPKITCPVPQTIQLTTNVTSTPVVYGIATAVNGKAPVTTTCAPASGEMFAMGQTSVSCTATDALQRTDECAFLVTVVPPLQLTATTFVAFGDSITWGEDGTNPLGTSSASSRFHVAVQLPLGQTYPSVLQQDLAGRYRIQTPTVANKGQPAEAVADRTTFPRFTSLMSSRLYSVVLIMEGTNDLFVHDSLTIPPAIAGLRQMVRDAKSRGIRPYLATIPPMNPAGFRGAAYSWYLVPEFNDRVRELAASEGVTLVDIYQGFNNNFALLGFDGLHPNADGYAKIADLFFAAIKQTLEVPPPFLGPARAFRGRSR